MTLSPDWPLVQRKSSSSLIRIVPLDYQENRPVKIFFRHLAEADVDAPCASAL